MEAGVPGASTAEQGDHLTGEPASKVLKTEHTPVRKSGEVAPHEASTTSSQTEVTIPGEQVKTEAIIPEEPVKTSRKRKRKSSQSKVWQIVVKLKMQFCPPQKGEDFVPKPVFSRQCQSFSSFSATIS